MALCDQIVGVKNILLKFTNCETGEVIGPIAHELSKEDLPKWRTHAYKSEMLPGGYVKKHHISAACEMDIRRDLRVSLEDYQGRSAIEFQVEYENGLVYTGASGGIEGDEKSDTHEVMLRMSCKVIEELRPPGAFGS